MGNDGGSIPTRRELVKEAARSLTVSQLKETQQERQQHLWTTDPLSNKPLRQPIVSDCNGRLFNKESIINYLLPSTDDSTSSKAEADAILQGAVKSLKDVVEVHFTISSSTKAWVCPVSNDVFGPACKAVYIVPCGHAFSASTVKTVSESSDDNNKNKCLTCNESYATNNVITILPTSDTEIARLVLRTKTLKENGIRHSLKKDAKKRKANDLRPVEDAPKTAAKSAPAIQNAATRALTDKVMREQTKRRKLENDNVLSLFSQSAKGHKDGDFMTRGFSIPADAKR